MSSLRQDDVGLSHLRRQRADELPSRRHQAGPVARHLPVPRRQRQLPAAAESQVPQQLIPLLHCPPVAHEVEVVGPADRRQLPVNEPPAPSRLTSHDGDVVRREVHHGRDTDEVRAPSRRPLDLDLPLPCLGQAYFDARPFFPAQELRSHVRVPAPLADQLLRRLRPRRVSRGRHTHRLQEVRLPGPWNTTIPGASSTLSRS